MKIYTKTGDSGETGLYGGTRVSKSELRIEAYGTVDELNSHLGLIATFELPCIKKEFFQIVQSKLFDMGALLAADPQKNLRLPEISDNDILLIEKEIDKMDSELPALKNFVLPGGSRESAHVHIARTVCRRAERRVVALHALNPVQSHIIQYLNRLSDFLFVLSRKVIQEQGGQELPWKPSL